MKFVLNLEDKLPGMWSRQSDTGACSTSGSVCRNTAQSVVETPPFLRARVRGELCVCVTPVQFQFRCRVREAVLPDLIIRGGLGTLSATSRSGISTRPVTAALLMNPAATARDRL